MNAFALLLFAWPLYLMKQGRLAAYAALAKAAPAGPTLSQTVSQSVEPLYQTYQSGVPMSAPID